MAFIEVGAVAAQTGALFPSKAALKRAWAYDRRSVRFISVATVIAPRRGEAFDGTVSTPADLPTGTKLTLVGPDPERQRNYYGTVEVARVRGVLDIKIS